MTDVFISYARSDQAEAERLARRLKQLGLSVWYDPRCGGCGGRCQRRQPRFRTTAEIQLAS